MKEPAPALVKLLGIANAVFSAIYFTTVIVVLKRPPTGPYPYRWLSLGVVFLSYVPVRFADQEAWPSFTIGVLGFVLSLGLVITLFTGH